MWFIDQNSFSLPLVDVLVNRDDFGGRRLQFSALDGNIELDRLEPMIRISRLVEMKR
jgi:hypothetical protein